MPDQPDGGGFPIAPAAFLTAVLTIISLVWQHRAALRDEVQLIGVLTSNWRSLAKAWRRTLLVARGPSSHYVPAGPAEVVDYQNLLFERHKHDSRPYPDDELYAYYVEENELTVRSRKYEQDAQEILVFLASLCLLVITGRLRPATAYSVCGLDIVRNGGSIRVLLEEGHAPPEWEDERIPATLSEPTGQEPTTAIDVVDSIRDWVGYRDGVRRRVLIMIDLLWAEAARLRDLSPWELVEAADAKSGGSGKRNRQRLANETHRAGPQPISAWRSLRLSRHLRHAEWQGPGRRLGISPSLREEAARALDESVGSLEE